MESTEEEKAAIDQQYFDSYYQLLAEWKEIDRIKKIIEEREHAKRVARNGSILTSDLAEEHQASRDVTSAQQSEPVSIPETKPLSSSARPHSVSLTPHTPLAPSSHLLPPSLTPTSPTTTSPTTNSHYNLSHYNLSHYNLSHQWRSQVPDDAWALQAIYFLFYLFLFIYYFFGQPGREMPSVLNRE